MKKAMLKNALTEIVKTKSRFISIFGILAIGCGFFAGLTVSEKDMKLSSDSYFDESSLMDFRLLSTYGFDEKDIEAVRQCSDDCEVYPSYFADCFIGEKDGGDVVRLYSLDNYGENNPCNTLIIKEGRLPQSADECIIDGSTIRSGYNIGDKFIVNGEDINDVLSRTEYTVVGFYNSPMFIDDTARGNTTIGTGAIETTAYIPSENFLTEYYTQLYVTFDDLTPYNCYSEEYEQLRDEMEKVLEDVGEQRRELRRDEIVSEAQKELDDGEKEYSEQKEKAEKELADAKEELDDAKKQLDDGKKELDDSRVQLDDAKKEITDNEKQLSDAKKELDAAKKELDENRTLLEDTKDQLDKAKAELDEGYPLLEDARKQTEDGERELAAAKKELDDGKKELDANRKLLDDSKAQLESGEKQLADSKTELDGYKKQLDDAQKQLDESEKTLAALKRQLDDAKAQLDRTKAQLDALNETVVSGRAEIEEKRARTEQGVANGYITRDEAEKIYAELAAAAAKLDALEAQYAAGLAEYEKGSASYEDGLARYNAGYAEYSAGVKANEQAIQQYRNGVAEYERGKKTLEESRAKYEAGEKQYAEGLKKYRDGLAEYRAGEKELEQGKAQYESALEEYESGLAQYNDGKKQYDDAQRLFAEGEEQYREGLAEYLDGEKQLNEGREKYEQGERDYADGLAKYEDSLGQYEDGVKEYEKAKTEAEDKLADAREELDDAQREIDSLEKPEWYIFDRADNPGFTEYGQNAERIHNIAMIFPLFFAMVAILVCLTTMTRMVEEQRTQIGTLKALGYGSGAIMFKYLLYGLSAALVGAVFGIFIGMKIFPYIIMNAYGMMYELPQYLTPYDFGLMLLVTAVAFLMAGAAVYFACKNILREQPASLMRPKPPKSGKKILLERIGFIWKHLSFSKKVSMRNLFRYKRRMLMTVFGIAGCTALLLTGFGVYDSVSDILNKQFDEISLYDGMAVFQDMTSAHRREAEELLAENGCDAQLIYQKQITVVNGSNNADANIFGVDSDEILKKYVDVRSRTTHEKYTLDDSHVIINEKLASLLGGVNVGDSITLRLSDTESAQAEVAAICENYAHHYVYISGALYQKLFNDELPYNCFYFNTPDGVSEEWNDELAESLMKIEGIAAVSYKTSVGDTFRNMLKSLQLIVVVLIVCAGILAFIVLYNLTNININERIREIATLKVLGFYDKEVSFYIFREIILLTLLGTAAGLLLGRVLLDFVVRTAEIDLVMFGREVHLLSFIWSILLTLVFAGTVMLFMHRKLKYVDMVEALKSVE